MVGEVEVGEVEVGEEREEGEVGEAVGKGEACKHLR